MYDDATLHRLTFVARAKQLGCSLEEITDLIGIWDGDDCAPVQRRFHQLVTRKLAATHRQIAELTSFSEQLATAAAHLGAPPTDGPCADDCACLAERATESPPIACTLAPGELPARVESWNELLRHALTRQSIPGGVALHFGTGVDAGELIRLAAAEQRCCTFFSFTVTIDATGVGLQVHAPDDAADIVAALFGGGD